MLSRMQMLKHPSEVVLLVDEGDTLNNGHFAAPTADDAKGSAIYTDMPTVRHSKGAVFAFADGHSKWKRPEQLKAVNFDPKGTP